MTAKRCIECATDLERGQYVYRNGWRAAPVCRRRSFCSARRGHRFRACHVTTPDGTFLTCGFVGCGYDDHRVRAALESSSSTTAR